MPVGRGMTRASRFQLSDGIDIGTCYRLPRQALWDSAVGFVVPLFNRMMVSPDLRQERAGEQPNEAGRYGRGEYKKAGPQSWARPLSESLATIAERDRKLPPRDLEPLSPPGSARGHRLL